MDHENTRNADSTDAKVTQDLIETLIDGRDGYAALAEQISDEAPQRATTFTTMSRERAEMADELRTMASRYGDTVDSDGSTIAAFHRSWMSVKDAVTGDDPEAVIAAAVKGEEHAIKQFEQGLEKDISQDLQLLVRRQLGSITEAKAKLAAMS